MLYEVLHQLTLADDGPASETTLRVVPLDAFGNVASLASSETVELLATGSLEIRWPDSDGDVRRETLSILDGRGMDVVVDDPNGALDDPNWGRLTVSSPSGIHFLDINIPDPDVDDTGLVDLDDLLLIAGAEGARVGDDDYESRFDLNGDSRIDDADVLEASAYLGEAIAIP